MKPSVSIILPARNEELNLKQLLPELIKEQPNAEIIVVDDHSLDNTAQVCKENNVKIVTHPYSKGNGASVKTGARLATGDILLFMDADGQHNPRDITRMLSKLNEGYQMVVGARNGQTQAGKRRWFGNKLYNHLASVITGHRIDDLTSGFRAVHAHTFKEFLYLLPNGFSYPTTITMAFFRSGFSIAYIPINAEKRIGKSHIRIIRDGIRFLLIIFRIGTLYSPLKVFLPTSGIFFFLGIGHYIYTYATQGRFTNMSALLIVSSVFIFLIGLISEQITNILYSQNGRV
ncbi:MAG: glycosyltransferase family 2 protein [Pseudomonadota bacterium]